MSVAPHSEINSQIQLMHFRKNKHDVGGQELNVKISEMRPSVRWIASITKYTAQEGVHISLNLKGSLILRVNI